MTKLEPGATQSANRLFGTNGIRGVVGKDLSVDLAYRVGSSVATLFKGRPVLVGRDGRASGRMIVEGVVSGILAQGNDVQDHDIITTPALQYLVKVSHGGAGIVVTASHNPPEYNGFKVIDIDGVEIPREKEAFVEDAVQRNHWTLSNQPGRRIKQERIRVYLDSIAKHLEGIDHELFKRLTVVVDVGNGVSALTTPMLLQSLGCKVVVINGNIDGSFPGRLSEPRPENLTALSRAVLHEKADLGIAHDGDGDRAIFVDETGTVHWGDRSFAVVEDMVLSENPGSKIVTPLNSSMAVKEIADKRNGRLILTKVGSIYVSRTMLKENAILGGEENGGIFYAPHHPVRDGTMAATLILKVILTNGQSLSKLMSRLPSYHMSKEKVTCKNSNDCDRAMRRLSEKLKDQISSTMDGIKVDENGRGWVLIRPSGTEPLIRIYAEGKTESDVNVIMGKYKPLVVEALRG
jgi:phosphomannomutase / phosphoglucomutase